MKGQILLWITHKVLIFLLKWFDLSREADESIVRIKGLLQESGEGNKTQELQDAILFHIRRKQRQTAGD